MEIGVRPLRRAAALSYIARQIRNFNVVCALCWTRHTRVAWGLGLQPPLLLRSQAALRV